MRFKKAQEGPMGLSFGVIFAIFLIIVFIIAAGYGIKHFIYISECSQIGLFYENLQKKIDEVFYASYVENESFKISLPSSIKKVCFINLSATITNEEDFEDIYDYEDEEDNLFIIPSEKSCDMPSKKLTKINLQEITKEENPYCVSSDYIFSITKKTYDKYVIIK
ncbi:MAG: hypothetical protein QW273_02085 [Candidatus Pacearchaeota archaeon]